MSEPTPAQCPACGGSVGDGTRPCAYEGCPKREPTPDQPSSDRLAEVERRLSVHSIEYHRPVFGAPCWPEYRAEGQCKCDPEADSDWLLTENARLRAQVAAQAEVVGAARELLNGWTASWWYSVVPSNDKFHAAIKALARLDAATAAESAQEARQPLTGAEALPTDVGTGALAEGATVLVVEDPE